MAFGEISLPRKLRCLVVRTHTWAADKIPPHVQVLIASGATAVGIGLIAGAAYIGGAVSCGASRRGFSRMDTSYRSDDIGGLRAPLRG